jgi:hypothetical protein
MAKRGKRGRVDPTQDNRDLCLNKKYSDVTLVWKKRKLPAHAPILTAKSELFQVMLRRHRPGLHAEIKIDFLGNENAFKQFLGHMYGKELTLNVLDDETACQVLALADRYIVPDLASTVSDYLQHSRLSVNNVCLIYDCGVLFDAFQSYQSLRDTYGPKCC